MHSKKIEEQELLNAIRQGGQGAEAAIARVYHNNRGAIEKLVRRNNGDPETAKDIMQEAVIAFYENVRQGRFKGESAISTYLYSIARFIWLNRLKRKKLESDKLQFSTTELHSPTLPPAIAEKELRQQLIALFNELGPDCREVLLQSIYEGYDMKTIAKNMGYDSDQIARNKKYLCLKKLKVLLREKPDLLRDLKL